VGWRTGEADLSRRIREVDDRVRAELGIAPAPGELEPGASLAELTATCLGELRTGRPPAARAALLALWVSELQACLDELSEQGMVRRARRLAECERGLRRLGGISATADLIDGVCDELIRSLGFARTMLARVEDGMWRPWKANKAMLDEPWVPEWIDGAIPLDELVLETELLRDRRPALITSTAMPGIAQMVHAANVSSYVVAPIMPAGQVVGFFHADHGIGGARCDVGDRDILWAFAEGFGHLYERTLLLEQLNARRAQVRDGLTQVGEELDRLAEADLELGSDADGSRPHPAVVHRGLASRLGALTARELGVLELVVAGASNGEIAERLAVSVATVKTHVKNIMAKLRVENRSQVIAAYFGAMEEPRVSRAGTPSPTNGG
jgi:DNA-binding CsgD family transcriptional regulator